MVSFVLFLIAAVLIIVLAPIIFVLQIIRKTFRKESIALYLHNLAVSLDQLGGALIYGKEDWTISSIAYYHSEYEGKNTWFMHFINFLFRDKDHCKNAFKTEYSEIGKYPI